MENHSGFKKLLKISNFYTILMNILGAKEAAKWLNQNFYKVKPGAKITDIGCGPGSLLHNYKHLFPTDIDYSGIDPNEHYIKSARNEFGEHANFYDGTCETFINDSRFQKSDLILCNGVLHHLNDRQVKSLFNFIHRNLKSEGGRFLAMEPVHLMKETSLSRWVMNLDRGMHVRKEPEWKKLMNNSGLEYKTNIITGLIRIPYNYILIEATIGGNSSA